MFFKRKVNILFPSGRESAANARAWCCYTRPCGTHILAVQVVASHQRGILRIEFKTSVKKPSVKKPPVKKLCMKKLIAKQPLWTSLL